MDKIKAHMTDSPQVLKPDMVLKKDTAHGVYWVDLTHVKEPWQQLPREPNHWYERFKLYCFDLGPTRTIYKAAKMSGVPVRDNVRNTASGHRQRMATSDWYAQSKLWRWSDRAAAWDRHVNELEQAEHLAVRKRIINMQYQMVENLTKTTLERIIDMDPDELVSPQDVIRAFEAAIKTGALVIGTPSERIENTGNVSFTISLGDRELGDGGSGSGETDI